MHFWVIYFEMNQFTNNDPEQTMKKMAVLNGCIAQRYVMAAGVLGYLYLPESGRRVHVS